MATSGNFTTTSCKNRSLTFSWTLKSHDPTNCTSTISWTLKGSGGSGYVTCKNIKLIINGETVYSRTGNSNGIDVYTTTTLASGTTTIQHDTTSGDKSFSASCSAGIYYSAVNCSGSGSWALPNIARKSTMTVSNGTLGTAQTITVTRQSTSFTHTITYVCGNDSGTICTKSTDTSVSWTPAVALAKNAPNGTDATIALTIETYNGDASIGTSTQTILAAVPTSVVPTVSLSVSDAAGYLATYGGYVQTKSTPTVTVTAEGAYGSSIRTYSTTIDGSTYTTASFTTGVLKTSGTLTVKTTVTDSRGRTATASTTITSLAYEAPKITYLAAQRCTSDGTANSSGDHLRVIFNATVSALNNKNTAAYTVKYKKTSATNYTTTTVTDYANNYSVTNGYCVIPADTVSSYDISCTVVDAFSSTVKSTTGSSIAKFFSWLSGGLGWAFGKVAEKSKTLELGPEWDLSVGGKIYDAFDTMIGGGLAAYSGGGDTGIDPNTTLEELCLTSHTNTPQGSGTFYYVHTTFYNTKSTTAARAQVAFPYNKNGSMYHRYYASGAWSSWHRYMTADEVFPVNSVVVMYTHDSPAAIYGGTWHRMQSRFLWGTTTEGTIGATGGEQTHVLTTDEMPAHTHGITYRSGASAGSYYGQPPYTSNSGTAVPQSVASTGGGEAHNNMPPYVNVAIWRRTA